ncbi:hypothetical protein GCM10007276_10670 [Agaricicola taiwanensis]|uniref:Uncharacterized protein n=2 Tax=Agaricicola taiwanensis TaxID=591372 RepID=A0A8J2YGG6_9RHOB|nr:hypothetical protein GCM10007276_10670 [Agaricicola taiwanensis]
MAQGKPVLTCGQDQTFVETGVTGILMEQFDAGIAADHLRTLASDRAKVKQLGQAARPRIAALCDPRRQAAALADVWIEAAQKKRGA